MERKNFLFKVRTEWSDRSEHSPTLTGQLPAIAVVGKSEVEIDMESINLAVWNRGVKGDHWVKMGHNVSCKLRVWGEENMTRSVGSSGATLDVLAPPDTVFLYESNCPNCGNYIDRQPQPTKARLCPECQTEYDRIEKEADESWAAAKAERDIEDARYEAQWREVACQ